MARGRKPRVRVTGEQLDTARKKIKNTPKRGRWPKYHDIHPCDLEDYIDCFQHPGKVFAHPKYGNSCFRKTGLRREDSIDLNFNVELPSEYPIIGTVRFYCESWTPNSASPLVDTECVFRCERISCPYNKKGFITETLKNRTFETDVTSELNDRHNKKQEIA